ncbi:HAD family hydrolase [Candidatus Cytomitobacter indipagum]|uniref:phosphoglycolate phosphatase n=1 Tax=Candidatus Cytomitobacter indipagum TaxID=2601575 RepID=A0A5C0UEP8_9PROT|nr:HAD-IA family hydrolase [Candidatus Cytomitobacter indipagum]QEK38197.1 HAD family hydrolase [Candidatus Cytomitobacter indipagum]
MPNLVIWDWSETIEKSENAHFFVMNKLLNKYTGKSFDSSHTMNEYWNQISFAVRNVIKAQIPIEIEKCSTWVAPYAISLIKYFKDNNIPQCIISNGDSKKIREQIFQSRLDYFDSVIGHDDGFMPKPNPSSILHLCKKYKLKNDHNVWMIGDSSQDMEFAMHAQVKGIKITDGLHIVWDEIHNLEK